MLRNAFPCALLLIIITDLGRIARYFHNTSAVEKFQPFFRQNFTFSTLYNFILLMLLILHIYPHTFRAGVIVSPFLSSFNLCKFSYLFLKHFCCAAVSMYPARIPVYPVLYLLYLFLCLSVKICSFRHFPAYHLICYLICSALP